MLNGQIYTLTQHQSRGWLDAAGVAEKSGAVNQRVSALRAERRKLLAEDENGELLDELHELNDLLALTELQTEFDGELFGQIITGITAASATELRFRLPGELAFNETISYRKRR